VDKVATDLNFILDGFGGKYRFTTPLLGCKMPFILPRQNIEGVEHPQHHKECPSNARAVGKKLVMFVSQLSSFDNGPKKLLLIFQHYNIHCKRNNVIFH
jgi:hypothetical protein